MLSNNVCIFIGNLVKDPEIISEKIAKFAIAVSGFKKEDVFFLTCILSGNNLKNIEYLKKGKQISVTGSLKIKKYKDKYYTELFINGLYLISRSQPDNIDDHEKYVIQTSNQKLIKNEGLPKKEDVQESEFDFTVDIEGMPF